MMLAEGANMSEDGVSLKHWTFVKQMMPEPMSQSKCPNSEGKQITHKVVNLKPTGDSANMVVDIFLRKHTELMGYFMFGQNQK